MHELSIMGNVLDIVLEYAGKNNAKEVKKINMAIGVMSDVIPDWAQTYFEFVSKDTIAEKAILEIERIPVRIKCKECGKEHEFKGSDDIQFFCPACESPDIELITGRDMKITSIEIEQ